MARALAIIGVLGMLVVAVRLYFEADRAVHAARLQSRSSGATRTPSRMDPSNH